MHVVVVYDTAAERNPQILRICRQYLHHVQLSVFEGQLTQPSFAASNTPSPKSSTSPTTASSSIPFRPAPPPNVSLGATPNPNPQISSNRSLTPP
ncbi:CRISPR-associated endonuclease Cas2 [Actinocorallia lasiicapitis]